MEVHITPEKPFPYGPVNVSQENVQDGGTFYDFKWRYRYYNTNSMPRSRCSSCNFLLALQRRGANFSVTLSQILYGRREGVKNGDTVQIVTSR